MSNEDLRAKYGRRQSDFSQKNSFVENNDTISNNSEENYSNQTQVFTKRTEQDKKDIQQEKKIKANIQEVLSKYSEEQQEKVSSIKKTYQETPLVKFLKVIISFLIIIFVVCVIVALYMKPQIDKEGDQIIEQIKRTEDLYYAKIKKYHYFSKTSYDHTLGIDLSNYKYFTSYEVVPDSESGNYAANTYGATNAFTITYYTIKAWLERK